MVVGYVHVEDEGFDGVRWGLLVRSLEQTLDDLLDIVGSLRGGCGAGCFVGCCGEGEVAG